MKIKKLLTIVLLFVSFGLVAFGGYHIFMIEYGNHKTEAIQAKYAIQEDEYLSAGTQAYLDEYAQTKAVNNDFIGWLSFDSGLINTAIVQTTDNDYYMTRDFEGNHDTHGTPCLSYDQNVKTSPNLTIFGHYVYADTNLVFGPLTQLMEPENYENNRYFELFLDDEVRSYQVVSVIRYTKDQETLFAMAELTPDQWGRYVQYINDYSLYDTGISASSSDRFVVLQTCIRNATEDRLLVIGKEIHTDSVLTYFSKK